MLEYGATQQLPLEGAKTIKGAYKPTLPDYRLWNLSL